MAGYGGQEHVPTKETSEWMKNYPASVQLPGFSSPACSPDSYQWELTTIQELQEWCTSLQAGPPSVDPVGLLMVQLEVKIKRENELVQKLKAAEKRESALSLSLANSTRRLWYEMHTRNDRETGLLQERSDFEAQIVEWKRLYSMALSSYQEVGEEIGVKEREHKDVNRAVNAHIEGLQSQLAAKRAQLAEKQSELDELAVIAAQKDLTILALEEDKQAAFEELRYVVNGAIKTVWDVSEQVLDLTVDLQEFQLRNKYGRKTTTPRTRPCQEMPSTLPSCAEEVTNRFEHAKSALTEAAKVWKKAEAGLEVMESFNRKRLLDKILGKEPSASDAGDETSAIETD